MRALMVLVSRVADVILWRRRDRRLDEEIDGHLAELRAEHERDGLTAHQAEQAARRAFGGVDQVKARYRDQRGVPALESLAQDVRFALRYLIRDRAFSVPLVLVLTLGIGVSHLFFTLTYAHTMRGLPMPDVARVLFVSTLDPRGADRPVSYVDFVDMRASQRSFVDLAAFVAAPVAVSTADRVPDRLLAAFTTASGFDLVGIQPVRGRVFTADSERTGGALEVVLTESAWHSQFGEVSLDEARPLLVDGVTATVIGVVSDKSGFPSGAGVFLPLTVRPGAETSQATARALSVFGRLIARATVSDAQEDLARIASRLAEIRPDSNRQVRFVVTPINERYIGGRIQGWLPFITAGLIVIAVASANAGNLMLAGTQGRARELAVRTAMGASRGRVMWQLVVECLAVVSLASVAGLGASRLGVRLYASQIPPGTMPYWYDYSLDDTVFAALVAMAFATVTIVALVPAWRASRVGVVDVLREGGRSETGRVGSSALGSMFLAVQLGLAVVLAAQVGLAAITRDERLPTDALLDDQRVLTGSISLPTERFATPDRRRIFFEQLADRLRATGDVTSVAFASAAPLDGTPQRTFALEGRANGGATELANVLAVGPGYFATLGTGVIRGRDLSHDDGDRSDGGVLVNERFAAHHFPGVDPIGQRISLREAGDEAARTWRSIVGVVPDLRERAGVPSTVPMVYVPLPAATNNAVVFVRTERPAAELTSRVRVAIQALDPTVPLVRPRSLQTVTRDASWVSRVSASLGNTVCAAALALAVFGLFAVLSRRTAVRRREIALRMALGAEARHVARVVLGSIASALGAGLALGIAGTAAWDRAFAPPPGSVSALRPSLVGAEVAVVAALAVAVLLGCAIPAVRAMRIAPAETLRRE